MKTSNFFWYLLSILSGFLIAGVIFLLNNNKEMTPITIMQAPTPAPIKVYLSGDIQNPGIYELPKDSRLEDLFTIANIITFPLEEYNLASKLYDGQHIKIEQISGERSVDISYINQNNQININEAEMDELMDLPGIGETKAKEIIMYRETHGYFDKIEDILNVPGIGEATFNQFKDRIVTNSIK